MCQKHCNKNATKALNKRVEKAYYATCNGIQIYIMDIGKLLASGRDYLVANPDCTDIQLGEHVRSYVESLLG
jgi:hypothetical protein